MNIWHMIYIRLIAFIRRADSGFPPAPYKNTNWRLMGHGYRGARPPSWVERIRGCCPGANTDVKWTLMGYGYWGLFSKWFDFWWRGSFYITNINAWVSWVYQSLIIDLVFDTRFRKIVILDNLQKVYTKSFLKSKSEISRSLL